MAEPADNPKPDLTKLLKEAEETLASLKRLERKSLKAGKKRGLRVPAR